MIGSLRRRFPQPLKHLLRFTRYHVQNSALMARLRLMRRPCVPGRVSVITPTYRRLAGLREAIESVLAQSYPDWEQLVIADGKDDAARNLVRSFGDPRVSYHHTLPFHVVGNYQRNFALRHATGEFILYLDDDNVIYPRCLETMVSGFGGGDVGYVVCGIHYGAERRVLMPAPGFRVQQIDTLNFMIRRKLIERLGGYGANYSADYGLISRVARISRGRHLDELIGHHR